MLPDMFLIIYRMSGIPSYIPPSQSGSYSKKKGLFGFFKKKSAPASSLGTGKKRRSWKKVLAVIIVLGLVLGGLVMWKAGMTLNKISSRGNIFSSLVKSLPGGEDQLQGEAEGRINILLLGMRGENVPGGGTLADTIMVLSLHMPKESDDKTAPADAAKASLISIPRDLYVTMPGSDEKRKINAAYALGHQRAGQDGAIEDMKKAVGEVAGQTIHYAVVINFQGFVDLVNAIGGIDVTLDQAFNESQQFHEAQVCDPYVYTVPTKPIQYQYKYYTRQNGTKYVAKAYPLCYNKSEECGGNFTLQAGSNHLDGKTALCYARSRYTSNDFERAKRQQQVIHLVKQKAMSLGTIGDFSKVNALLDSLGDNVRTDMAGWEMKRFFDTYQQKFSSVDAKQKVLDNTEEGLLYDPPVTPEAGYILLPRGDNYERIHALFQNPF